MFPSPIKLAVGQTVAMHGGDNMKITQLPLLIGKDAKF